MTEFLKISVTLAVVVIFPLTAMNPRSDAELVRNRTLLDSCQWGGRVGHVNGGYYSGGDRGGHRFGNKDQDERMSNDLCNPAGLKFWCCLWLANCSFQLLDIKNGGVKLQTMRSTPGECGNARHLRGGAFEGGS